MQARYPGSDKSKIVPFVVDAKYAEQIANLNKKWYYKKSCGAIGCHHGNKELFLHDLIWNLKNGESPRFIRHINLISLDNREANLQEEYANMKKRERKNILPVGCPISPQEVPTYVWYHRATQQRGARFSVEIPELPKWKTTGSRKLSLSYKLEEAKKFLRYLKRFKPQVFKNNCMNGEYTEDGKKMLKSFYGILRKAGYQNVEMKDVGGLTDKFLAEKLDHLSEAEKRLLRCRENSEEIKKAVMTMGQVGVQARRCLTNLPPGCGIKNCDLPKYSYYRPSSVRRGDYFVVENHPHQSKRYWQTTTSKYVSIQYKFKELNEYLANL